MRIRVLLPALISSTLLACSGGGGSDRQEFSNLSLFDPIASDPVTGTVIPFPFDGLFSGFSDPTLNIPNPNAAPFVTAANLTDGFSTTASIFTDVLGFVDYSSAADAVLLINSTTGERLEAGVDFLVQRSPALATVSGSNPPVLLPIDRQRSRLLIEPLKPLAPSTRYLVAITRDLRSRDGLRARPSEFFRITASTTPVPDQPNLILAALTPLQLGTLEALRTQLILPTVQGITALTGVPVDDLVIAWSFTTQSTSKTLQLLNDTAVAGAVAAGPTGLSTGLLGLGLPDTANIFAGTLTVPYYLSASGGNTHSTAPLTDFWLANAALPDTTATFLGQVPCGAFAVGAPLPGGLTAAPSVSTTICYPTPVKRSDQTIPLLITVPNANSGRTKPAAGWPLVVFQHGITGNRTQMLAIAPALAAAGFAVAAIDLPLHGLPPNDPSRIPGVGERTFDLDLVNNTTSAPGPDGTADSSGTHFINLSSLITSRDNLRQAVSDLIVLTRSAGAINLDGNAATADIDATQIRFVGHSLGGIVGTTLLGVNSEIGAASLAMPGGGVAKLLDASKSFGSRIAAGLAGNGVIEGTDTYETFLRFAQHLVDPGDPVNFAADAALLHPIHMIEVVSDLVVPNNTPATEATATQDLTTISGYLSGTDPLARLMGLQEIGPLSVPAAAQAPLINVEGVRALVRFSAGDHGSILSPAASLDVTIEMQREVANFIASNGVCLPIGGGCS